MQFKRYKITTSEDEADVVSVYKGGFMAEEILWEEEQISADLAELEEIVGTYEGETRLSYKFSEGMKVADSYLDCRLRCRI